MRLSSPVKRAAAQQAYRDAGIKPADVKRTFDLAEVADATPYQELIALDARVVVHGAEVTLDQVPRTAKEEREH